MYAYFNRFTIQMTKAQAKNASHPGPCDQEVKELSELPQIKRQFKKINPVDIAKELQEYGAWDETELQDNDANIQRILWIAAGYIIEIYNPKLTCSGFYCEIIS